MTDSATRGLRRDRHGATANAGTARTRASEMVLVGAVRAGLNALSDRAHPDPHDPVTHPVAPERLVQYLRAALTVAPAGSGPFSEAVAAVTAACADLDTGDLPGAYLALRVADTALHDAATA